MSFHARNINKLALKTALETGWVGGHELISAGTLNSPENFVLAMNEIIADAKMPISKRLAKMAILNEELIKLEEQQNIDHMTGLFNKAAYDQKLTETFKQVQNSAGNRKEDRSFFLMIDGDNFKAINDNYGYDVGDQAIILIANTLKDSVRKKDLVFRRGGDEFAIILSGVDVAGVKRVINKINNSFLALNLSCDDQKIPIRISIGYEEFSSNGTANSIAQSAEDNMKVNKAAGKRGRDHQVKPTLSQ